MLNKKFISIILFLLLLITVVLFTGCDLISYCEIVYGNTEDCPMIYGKPMVFQNDEEIDNNGSYDFGYNIVYLPAISNTEGVTKEFTIKNVGTYDMIINELNIFGNSDYTIDTTDTLIQTKIPKNESTTFKVRFLPSSRGTMDGNITIVYKTGTDSGEEKEYTFNLIGTGTAPEIKITQDTDEISEQSTFSYDPTNVGESVEALFTLENVGTEDLIINDLNLYNFTADDTIVDTDYSFILENTNTLPITLQPTDTINFKITYEPKQNGDLTADLIISNDDFYFDNPFDFTVQGYVEPSQLIIKDSNDNEITYDNFGEIVQNSTSETRTYTLQNSGMNNLEITEFTVSGDVTHFTYDTLSPMTLAPEEEVDITVQFNPTTNNYLNLQYTITTDSTVTPTVNFYIYGRGVNYDLEFVDLNAGASDGNDSFTYPHEVANSRRYWISGTVQNNGLDAIWNSFDVGVYISDDTTINPDEDTFLNNYTISYVGASGGTSDFTVSVTIPDEVYTGTRYFGFIVDYNDTIPEMVENNNNANREYTQVELGVIYVDGVNGDDSNTGEINSPLATINEGLYKASINYDDPNDIVEIRIAKATYDEQVDIPNRLSLIGGFSSDWSENNYILHPTILKNTSGSGDIASGNYTLQIGSGANNNVYIMGLIIGASDNDTESTAVLLSGDSSAHIQGNDIYVGDADTSYAVYSQNTSFGYFMLNYFNDDYSSVHPTPGANSTNTYGVYVSGDSEIYLLNNQRIEGGYGTNSTAIYSNSSAFLNVSNNTTINGGYNTGTSYGIVLEGNVSANINSNSIIYGSLRESTYPGGTSGDSTAIFNNTTGKVVIMENTINGGLDGKNNTTAISDNTANDLLIIKNTITAGEGLISSTGIDNTGTPYIINNLISGGSVANTTSKAIVNNNTSNGMIVSNTIYGGEGTDAYCIDNTVSGVASQIKNNILFSKYTGNNYGITNNPSTVSSNDIFVTNDLGNTYIGTNGNIFARPFFTDVGNDDVGNDDYTLSDETPISITQGGEDITTDIVSAINGLDIPWFDTVTEADITDLNDALRTAPWSMGAYEDEGGSTSLSIYVSTNAGGTITNGTQQYPYKTIADGFNGFDIANMNSGGRGGVMKIAGGDYNITSQINMINNISLEGGYNPSSWDNDGSTTSIILNTSLSGADGSQLGIIEARSGISSSTFIRGLTISNVTGNASYYMAGILCEDSSLVIDNNTITIDQTDIGNEAYGIYNTADGGDSNPNITQNTISFTGTAIDHSYGIYNNASSTFINEPIISQNSIEAGDSNTESAGIKNVGTLCNPTIQNNTKIVGGSNCIDSYGIFNSNSNVVISNNNTTGTGNEKCIRPGIDADNSFGILNDTSTSDTFTIDITNNLIGGGDGTTKSVGICNRASDSSATLEITIDGNEIDGEGSGGSGNSYGIENDNTGFATFNVYIINNTILGGNGITSYGVQNEYCTTQYIIGNRISGEGSDTAYGIFSMNSGTTLNIINNLISGGNSGINNTYGVHYNNATTTEEVNNINNTIDAGGGITAKGISLTGLKGTINVIDNNIIFSTVDASNSYAIFEEAINSEPTSVKNNNIFDCDYVYHNYIDGAGGDLDLLSVANLNASFLGTAASGNVDIDLIDADDNGDDADSFFINYAGVDGDVFTIQDNDWHITASTDVDVRGGGLDHNTIFVVDKDGNNRTTAYFGQGTDDPTNGGEGWTIGAYEQDY